MVAFVCYTRPMPPPPGCSVPSPRATTGSIFGGQAVSLIGTWDDPDGLALAGVSHQFRPPFFCLGLVGLREPVSRSSCSHRLLGVMVDRVKPPPAADRHPGVSRCFSR